MVYGKKNKGGLYGNKKSRGGPYGNKKKEEDRDEQKDKLYYLRDNSGNISGPISPRNIMEMYDFGSLRDETEVGIGYADENENPERWVEIQKSDLPSRFERIRAEVSHDIMLTTESVPSLNINQRLAIVTAECVFGMNLLKDVFSSLSDVFGGRNKSTQDVLRQAREQVLTELRKEAYYKQADAVVGVDLDYSEFSGQGKSMLFVVASGTAVNLE